MYNVSVPMALMDFVPVALFGITAVLLNGDLHNKMRRGAAALFAAGCINIFCAGFLKALWKLLYGAGICDFTALNTIFLPLQSVGFLLAGLGIVAMFCRKKKNVLLAVPPVFSGTFVFIMMMVLGLGAICTALSVLAAKLKRRKAIGIFLAAFLCYMGMGYMSSRDSASAAVNWIEQSINCVGQALLLWGTLLLHKAGLAELVLKE